MSQFEKILLAILSGTRDSNIQFADLQAVLIKLGFQCRVRGDHFIYTRDGIEEIINLQPTSNRKAKPYQVKYWSEEDGAYIAEVPELAGCMADGATAAEALAAAERVIQEWIETAQELGRPIPAPKGRLRYA